MASAPRWFKPVAVAALLWNLLGCVAFVADLSLTPEDVAKLDAAQQAMYAARPWWSVLATGVAVIGGALGCIGLIIGKRWSYWLLLASLLGVIAQDVSLLSLPGATESIGAGVIALQGLVLVIAILLVFLARKAGRSGWVA